MQRTCNQLVGFPYVVAEVSIVMVIKSLGRKHRGDALVSRIRKGRKSEEGARIDEDVCAGADAWQQSAQCAASCRRSELEEENIRM